MEIGSLLLMLALLVLVALFVGRPLFDKQGLSNPEQDERIDHQLSSLLAERDQVLHALHELDLDYSLGKIPELDYPIERAALLGTGARILSELDQIQDTQEQVVASQARSPEELPVPGQPVQQTVIYESVPVGANGSTAQPNGSRKVFGSPDDDLEAMLANRRRVRQEKAAGFCPKCGNAIQKTDQFCPKCGNRLG